MREQDSPPATSMQEETEVTDADLAVALLDWFDENQREMPWRSDPKPYHVLLSELMLQQTRVETVLPYYRRFLKRWPTLERFAELSGDAVSPRHKSFFDKVRELFD